MEYYISFCRFFYTFSDTFWVTANKSHLFEFLIQISVKIYGYANPPLKAFNLYRLQGTVFSIGEWCRRYATCRNRRNAGWFNFGWSRNGKWFWLWLIIANHCVWSWIIFESNWLVWNTTKSLFLTCFLLQPFVSAGWLNFGWSRNGKWFWLWLIIANHCVWSWIIFESNWLVWNATKSLFLTCFFCNNLFLLDDLTLDDQEMASDSDPD